MTQAAQAPQNILVIRLSALGDVIMSSGLITALRARYPQARISWLSEPPAAPLLRHNPDLHEVIIWQRGEWQALWHTRRRGELLRAVVRFRRELRERRFDLVLDAHGLLKSGLLAWMTGAPRRIGLIPREGSQWMVHEKVEPPASGSDRIGSEYRYLAQYLGARDEDFRLNLAVGPEQRHLVDQVIAETGIRAPIAILCPFTTRPQKHWFEDRWARLADHLSQQGLAPVMVGAPADKPAADRIAAQSRAIINLTGRFKLDESVALIARSQLLIGVDTGLTHAGTALRIPTVALFGSTRPYLRTDSPATVILYDALSCSPCRKNPTCEGRFDCMRQLDEDRVLRTALAQLPQGSLQ